MRRHFISSRILGAIALALAVVALSVAASLVGGANAGGDATVTVNSTANIDDGDCEGVPNNNSLGNCTLREAIKDGGNISFWPPVFSKEQPGVIELCGDDSDGQLPAITDSVVIDSKDSGVIIDGGAEDGDCSAPAQYGLRVAVVNEAGDIVINGGKNLEIRNVAGTGIDISVDGVVEGPLGSVEIAGVIIANVAGDGIRVTGSAFFDASISNSVLSSVQGDGIVVSCDNLQRHVKITDVEFADISGDDLDLSGCPQPTPTPSPTPVLPDLTVSKTASSMTVEVGAEVSFFIEVRNEGTGLSPFTRVVDDLPAAFTPADFSTSRGTCAISGSVEGGTLDCDLGFLESGPGGFANVVVAGSFALAGEFENFAEVDPFDLISESNEGNNSSSVTITVSGPQPATPSPTSSPPATLVSTATPTQTPAATLAPSSTPTPMPATPDGDVSCDGTTDAIDAALILQVVAGLLSTLSCAEDADVNGDGVVGPIDAALILQAAAGLLTLPL